MNGIHGKNTLLPLLLTIFLVGCSNEEPATVGPDWPTGLITPIEGATFSMDATHLPSTPQKEDNGTATGFIFANGASGRPLANEEPVRAVAAGTIVRIDHNYEPPGTEALEFWQQNAAKAGLVRNYAVDQLRGRQIWVRHDQGHISRYAHLSEAHPEIQPGDTVEQGQVIGLLGDTGLLAAEDRASLAPRLQFELWSADGKRYFGQDLTPLATHRAVARVFSDKALPRYARRIVAQIAAGEAGPDEYPPNPLPDTGFTVDLPDAQPLGSAFAAPITWEKDDFRASDFFAALEGHPLGVIEAPDGAWLLGAMPLEAAGKELTLLVGATDPYGQTLMGKRVIESTRRENEPQAIEIDAARLEPYTEENLKAESRRLDPVLLQAVQQTEPYWNGPFQAPLEGDVTRPFGQRAYHGTSRPAHPLPGIAIAPTAGPRVRASNNGVVGFAGELPIRGRTVALIHGGGVVSIYAHLDEISVADGDRVSKGDPLGRLERTGAASQPQLRWEVLVVGIPTDPIGWLDRTLPGR